MNEPKTFVQNELAKNEWICKIFDHTFDYIKIFFAPAPGNFYVYK